MDIKIDSHQHFWKYEPIRDAWITEDMAVIQRDFLPGDLHPLLIKNGISGCVVVQSDQSEEENAFQLDLSERHAFIKGVVGWVDFQAEDIKEKLEYYSQFQKMKGFRHILQGEKDRAFMLRPDFLRGISSLADFGYTYDILIFPDQLKPTKEFVARFPNQLFVIDHLAKPYIKDKKISDWKKDVLAVAAHENVSCKISGMVTEAKWNQWTFDDFVPYLDVVVEAFGMKRIMYGSDWPVCLLAATYQEELEIVKKYFSSFSTDEQDDFFGNNASSFYRLI